MGVRKERMTVTVDRALVEAASQAVAFNFLSSQTWCGEDWLTWHRPETVLDFCRSLGGEPRRDESYLDGDCTIAVARPGA